MCAYRASSFRIAEHMKGNAKGVKLDRESVAASRERVRTNIIGSQFIMNLFG